MHLHRQGARPPADLFVCQGIPCLLVSSLDLDYLLAARTAPCHSWRNPVERVMSTLNLGLQCVGLERQAGDDRFELEARNCNSLSALREEQQ